MQQRKEPALRLIIAYKLVRASGSLVAAVLLAVATATGHIGGLRTIAEELRRHAMSAWSIRLANAVFSAVEPRHLWLVALALTLDGTLSFAEGWALHRAWWWGPWLVVAATASLMPFEVLSIVHHRDATRVAVLVVNLAVALYLARRALHHGGLMPRR